MTNLRPAVMAFALNGFMFASLVARARAIKQELGLSEGELDAALLCPSAGPGALATPGGRRRRTRARRFSSLTSRMDLFLAGCQGLGLALAVGALAGAVAPSGQARWALGALAAALGAFLFGASLTPEDHPAWPGWVVGAPIAFFTFWAIADVATAARRRAGGDGTLGIVLYLGAFALALAGLSLLPTAPIALVALLGTVWLYVGRRRRADEKHAGLRSLR